MTFAPVPLRATLAAVAGGAAPERSIRARLSAIHADDPALRAFHALSPDLRPAFAATGPLAGVSLGVKDIIDTADMPTAYGSPIHAGHRPAADASVVAMARMKGAAIIGKTETCPFAFLDPAPTRNAVDPAHTPGGSSAGSAAAVAAGLCEVALGTQTAGSVLRPAAFNGVCGYKPSFRLLPTVGVKPFAWTLDTLGVFAAGVADAALFAALLTGRDLAVPETPAAPHIGVYRSAIDGEMSAAMAEAVERAARAAERAGARVTIVEEPEALARGRDAQGPIQLHEGALALLHERRAHADDLGPRLSAALDEGAAIVPERYDECRRLARIARRTAATLFESVDALLLPAAPGAAPRSRDTTGSPVFNKLWTLTGNPAVAVPGLLDPAGMPLGIQVVARFGRDRVALEAAAFVEAALRRFEA
ncbi:amidase [Antarcticirhabdus aurantiaca]|uniref:Amidase n=1 Tax=Antarcticirhabdus aurantiaca TaxID=2606717 RepID=A0ACD4NIB0_9HYPH|nr:amidase [Antarcticirhabdus aurantiaca]WAJ26555.1 amidase [Jeongeuplla avenae]